MTKPDDTNQGEGFEPLHKVLDDGGPIGILVWVCRVCAEACRGGKPDECQQQSLRSVCPLMARTCPRCSLSAAPGQRVPTGCPCTEEQIGTCPLRPSQCRLCGAGHECNLQNCSRADCGMESAP